jgi:hypothetical protein
MELIVLGISRKNGPYSKVNSDRTTKYCFDILLNFVYIKKENDEQ